MINCVFSMYSHKISNKIDNKIISLWHFGAGVIIRFVYGFAVKPPSTVISVPVI